MRPFLRLGWRARHGTIPIYPSPSVTQPAVPPEPALNVRPLPRAVRWLLLVFAVLCLVMGLIGVIVPGLPTTVFILMAAWAAARSSPRLHGWLMRHRLFGPMLVNWQNGGFVSRRAKWSATMAMAVCAVILWLTAHQVWGAWLGIGSMACVLVWLWFRPEPPALNAP